MASETNNASTRRRLLLAGVIAVLAFCGIAIAGIVQRARSAQVVAHWTEQQAIPTVSLARLSPEKRQALTLPGTIQAYYSAAIYAQVSGYVKDWRTDIGAHVTAGQIMATIETPELDQQYAQARAALVTAAAAAQLASQTARRTNALVKAQWVSQQTADTNNSNAAAAKATMQAAAANVRRLAAMETFKQIVAPFDGVVTARNTDIGALVSAGNAGQALFQVADLHRVRIYVQVPQAFSAQIHPGQQASFHLPQFRGQSFSAAVVTTSNAISAGSRSMLVELQADNSAGRLLPGEYARVSFHLPRQPNVVQLPASALIVGSDGMQVATLDAAGRVRLQPVRIGRDLGGSVEIVSGLTAADRVVDNPQETLRNGDVVRVAAQAAGAAGDRDTSPHA